MASKDLVEALELACAEICAGCRYDALLVAGDSGHHKPRIGGFTPCRARVQRKALANHRECDALEALRAIMDCHKNSIPDEVLAEARRVVEAAGCQR